jgi:hypothetical protein
LEEDIWYLWQSVSGAKDDEDDKRKSYKKLKDLKIKLDSFEKTSKFDVLVERFEDYRNNCETFFWNIYKDDEERSFIEDIKNELSNYEIQELKSQYEIIKIWWENAIKNKDSFLLANINEQLGGFLVDKIREHSFVMWVHRFNECKTWWYNFTDLWEAELLFKRWEQAINNGDKHSLKETTNWLINLTPWKQIWGTAKILMSMSGITV